ncbi:MAG: multiheme c-type cytochrome, partial [SAR324 cluster bacterium]|nr:multiheme c-type cytochrome [SAR324 cluster bacterium]
LTPENCGVCHADQFRAWGRSLHSKAMGPGLLGQHLDSPIHDSPTATSAESCMNCHAPLAEQKVSAAKGLEKKGLHQKGIVCAACHLRNWQVKGPPPRVEPSAMEPKPHGGYTVQSQFENPLFCAPCHQFPDDGYKLEGKLLVNTYKEWRASKYASDGVTCQKCHMPDRSHSWKGIHSPYMTKKALRITNFRGHAEKGLLTASITLKNVGAGHALPTYVTPLIQIDFIQLDSQGKELPKTKQSAFIGRKVSLSLAQEFFDTRLFPEESRKFVYEEQRHLQGAKIKISVTVKPDEFYVNLYRERLKDPSLVKGRAVIEKALAEGLQNEFSLWEMKLALGK